MALNQQQFELLKQRLQSARDSGNYVRNPITGQTIRVETPADIMRGGQPQAPATQALQVARGEPKRGNIITRTLDTASKGLIGFAGNIAPVYKDIGYDIAALLTLKDMKKLEVNQQALFSKVMERLKDPNIPDYRKQQYVAMFKRINPDLISGVPEFNRTALQRVGAMVQTAVAPAFAGRLPATVAGSLFKGAALGEISGAAERVSEGKGVGRAAVGAIPGALLSGGLFAGARALAPQAATLPQAGKETAVKALETAKKTGTTAKTFGRGTTEAVFGRPGQQGLAQSFRKPEQVQEFIQGKQTFETLDTQTKKAIQTASEKSYKAFQAVVEKVPETKISKAAYNTTVKNIVKDLLGIETKAGQSFTIKNLRKLVNKETLMDEYLFGEAEAKATVKLLDRVLTLNDKFRTAKGVLELRQALDKPPLGIKEGLANYNKLFNALRSGFNKLASDKYPTLRDALTKASNEIRLSEELKFNLIGGQELSVEQTAIKLEQISRKIGDPLVRRATIELLQQLYKRTGLDLEELLRSAQAARQTNAPLPGIRSLDTLLGIPELALRGTAKVTRGVGLAKEAGLKSAKEFLFKPR